jgi:predicted transcriptional regulator
MGNEKDASELALEKLGLIWKSTNQFSEAIIAYEECKKEIVTLTAERDALKEALKNLVDAICEHIDHNAEGWQEGNNCPVCDKALSALKAANAALTKKQEP